MKAKVTNTEVGDLLGLSGAMISRIRSGERVPSLEHMLTIADKLEWTLDLQALSWKLEVYHEGFEAALATKYGEVEDASTPADGTPA